MSEGQRERAGESGFDLFDRWLAHRDQEQSDVTGSLPADAALDSPLFVDTSVDLGVLPEELLAAAPTTVVDEPPEERSDNQAARAVLAALAAERTGPVTPPDSGAHVGVAERGAAAVTGTADRGAVTGDPLPAVAAPRDVGPVTTAAPVADVVEFAPRSGARRVVGLVLLVALGATVVAAYVAWQDRTGPSIGIAAALALLTGIVWAVRAGSAVTRLTVRGGQLEILRGGSRHLFDLTSRHTPVDIVGEPGSRGWKVLFQRRSMAPFVVDASMVDPVAFTRVVRHYRPAPD
jgi:hypothetical protein